MTIKPRDSEIESVMAAIEKEDSLEGVAKVAISAAYGALQARPAPGGKLESGLWVVATAERQLYGPFGTYGEAEKAVTNGRIPNLEAIPKERLDEEGYVPSSRVAILPMRGPISAAEAAVERDRLARLFANHLCGTEGCGHKTARHNVKTGKCPVKNCSCTKPREVKL